jgi:hypothetical protein
VVQNIQAFRQRGHHAVFDAVVHHLDEMAGAAGPAVEIASVGCGAGAITAGRERGGLHAGRQGGEDRIQAPDRLLRAADHETVAALASENAATGSHIDEMNPATLQFGGAAHIVVVVRIAAIDDGVSGFEQRSQFGNLFVDNGRGQHEPDGPRFREPRD